MMSPKPLDGGENGTTLDLENGPILGQEDHGTYNPKPIHEPPKKMLSRMRSGALLASIKNTKASPSYEKLGEENENQKDKERLRRKIGKPPRAPRPPKHPGSTFSRLDIRIAKQISEGVNLKRAKLEKLKSWKRMKVDRVLPVSLPPSSASASSSTSTSSSSASVSSAQPSSIMSSLKVGNIAAMAFTALLCYVIVSQGFLGPRV